PHVRRHLPLAGAAARSAARDPRPDPVCRERREEAHRHSLDGGGAARGARSLRAPSDGGARDRRAAQVRSFDARDPGRAGASRRACRRRLERRRAGDVPALARRSPADERNRAARRPRPLRGPPPCEDGGGALRDAAGATGRGSGDGHRAGHAAAFEGERGRADARAGAAHGRAGEVGDERGLCVPRNDRGRVHRRAGRTGCGRARHGLRSHSRRRADRGRHLAAGQRDGHLLRHDAHVRRRRRSRRRARVAPPVQGGARARDRRGQGRRRREGDLRHDLRHLRGGRGADTAHEERRRAPPGRVLPRARPRRRPRGARAAGAGNRRRQAPRRGGRRHDRTGSLPAGLRRCPPRGPRARHGGRLREPHAVPVRPRALSARDIDTLFLEERQYPPPAAFAAQANAQPSIYDEDVEVFWEREAKQRVHWFEPFTKVCEWELPYAKWFIGGKLNVAWNCLDKHVEAGLGDRVAYYWEGEPADDRRALTYADLLREATKLANALRALGVGKGTPVGIYMGMVPEAPIAMLACARLGAPHTVVFGGFSADSLSDRLQDMGCEVLITQDEAWRRGTTVPLKRTADEAVSSAPGVRSVVVLRRTGGDVPMTEGRDHWWHEIAMDESECPAEPMDPEDLLYLLYTSGTTAKPKGIAHTTGGYLVGVATTHWYVFDLKPERDVYWCAADVGWVTGHSYIVYGPLCNGATSVLYEGTPDYPDKDRWWDV